MTKNHKNSHPLENHYNKMEEKENYSNKEEKDVGYDDFKIIDGRKFINVEESCAFLPVDHRSMSIMEKFEVISQHIWNGKFSSPVKETLDNGGAFVIDVGCGPATWLMFMAEEFPKSSFVGIDIAIDLKDSKKELPTNIAMIKHNILDGLPFPDNTFDFVHQKHMLTALKIDQWPFVIDELIRITKPGGWIEFVEYEYLPYSFGPLGKKILAGYVKLCQSHDIIDGIHEFIGEKLTTSDEIIEISHRTKNFPLGGIGIAGEMYRKSIIDSIETIRPYLSSIIGISLEEYDEMIKQFVLECIKYKSYLKITRIYGKTKAD
nr:9944_t:CDS:2 [Entrophospora candida]